MRLSFPKLPKYLLTNTQRFYSTVIHKRRVGKHSKLSMKSIRTINEIQLFLSPINPKTVMSLNPNNQRPCLLKQKQPKAEI